MFQTYFYFTQIRLQLLKTVIKNKIVFEINYQIGPSFL